jgi:HEAT repeat protein
VCGVSDEEFERALLQDEFRRWRPYANQEEFHGVNQYIANQLHFLVNGRRVIETKSILTNLLGETTLEMVLRTLMLVARLRRDLLGKGMLQEVIFEALDVPEFIGIDCDLELFFQSALERVLEEPDIQSTLRKTAEPILDRQLNQSDSFFLDLEALRNAGLSKYSDKAQKIRTNREKGPLVWNAAKRSSRAGMFDLREVFSTARGFELMSANGYGPWETPDRARESLLLLSEHKLIDSSDLPTDETKKKPKQDGTIWQYRHLFKGFSNNRITLFNSIVQSLDIDEQTRAQGVKIAAKDGSKKWLGPLRKLSKSNDTALLTTVSQALQVCCCDESRNVITPLLSHPNQMVSGHAAYALGQIGNVESIPDLLAYAEYDIQKRGQIVISSISEIGGSDSFEAAKKMMNAVNDATRVYCVNELAKTRVEESIPVVLDLLIYDNITLANLAISRETMKSILFRGMMVVPINNAIDSFAKYGEMAVSPLKNFLSLFSNKNLEGIPSDFLTTYVGRYLQNRADSLSRSKRVSEHIKIIPNILRALGCTHSHNVLDTLKEYADDADRDVQRAVIDAIAMLGGVSLEYAKELMQSDIPALRIKSLKVMRQINHRDALLSIIEALDDKDEDVKGAARTALSVRREREAMPLIKKVLKSVTKNEKSNLQMYLRLIPVADLDASLLKS